MRTYRMLLTTVSLLLLSTLSAKAQTEEARDKSVYVEILGASNGIGINYDARFKHESPWVTVWVWVLAMRSQRGFFC